MRTLRISLAVGVVAGALAAAPAGAVDTPLSGIKLKVSDATQPGGARRKIITVSKDAGIVIPADGGASDPSLNGGTLEIVNTAGSGESDVIPLPAGNWIRIPGDPLAPLKGWKFKQVVEDPPDDDFRIKVLLKTTYSGGVLRAVVSDDRGSVIGYTLDESSQGSIGIRLTTGADTQCVDFGGTVVVDESEDLGGSVYRGRFIAKAALAPPDCGSPSGAFVD